MLNRSTVVFAFAALLCAALPGLSRDQGGFEIHPITIEAHHGLASVVVSNPNDQKIYLATAIYDWAKDADGMDVLHESGEALASPPAMWIPPHATYTLRVQVPEATGAAERPFRVMVKRVPGRDEIVTGRIVFAVTQNLPAFSEPDTPIAPALSARIADRSTIVFSNTGTRRARIQAIMQDGRTLAAGLVAYVLAQSSLPVHLPAAVHPGTVEVDTDQGRHVVHLP